MRIPKIPFLRRFVKDELGQTAVLITLTMVAMTAMSAMGIETGHIYYAYRLLQASTNAAALAAGEAMPNLTQSQSNATAYSAQSGQLNHSNLLQSVVVSTNFYCSSNTTTALNIQCQAPISGEGSCTTGSTCNAVTVTQTASVPLWFGGLLGFRTINLRAMGSAAMKGGNDQPYNIAVIIDTTGSMGTGKAPSSDGCGGNDTQIQCAVYGLQQFLLKMDPCPLNTTCSATGPYVDDVALFVFPAVAAGDASDDTTCPTTNPPTVPYNFTNVTSGTSQDLNLWDALSGGKTVKDTAYQGSYEVVTFNNTYRQNDLPTTGLSASDPLAVAAGGGGSRCQGLQAPGGQETYYAQVIRAAEATLESMSGYPATGSKNIMIILSDGDSNVCNYQANTAAGGNAPSNDGTCDHNEIVADNCPGVTSAGVCTSSGGDSCPPTIGCSGTPLNGTGTSTSNSTGYRSPSFPSAIGQCGQAVEASQYATSRGTTVYTVAMGSPTSMGCTTDANYTVSDSYTGSTYGLIAWPSGTYPKQPCNAIEAMASAQRYAVNGSATFYSDVTKGCSAPAGTASYTTIGSIFQAIAGGLTNSRLIPPGA